MAAPRRFSKRLRLLSPDRDVSQSESSKTIASRQGPNTKDSEDAESRSAIMSSFSPIEVTQGTTGSFASDFFEFACNHEDDVYLDGETFAFPKIEQRDGLKFLEARVISSPEEDEDEVDLNVTLRMAIEVDSTVHSIENGELSEDFKNILSEWITNDSNPMKITACEVHPCDNNDSSDAKSSDGDDSSKSIKTISITVHYDEYNCEDWFGNIVESPYLDEVWNKHMYSLITEGVCYAEHKVPDLLRDSLRAGIDDVAKNTVIDYHPNSSDIVRDLVHPALYPYIKGVSPTVPQFTPVSSKEKSDFWQRPYEDSVYQWLPTPFKVVENGKCSILEYINNLDREKFPCLYKDLEHLFEIFLPYFEEVWSYARALELYSGEGDDDGEENKVVRPLKKEPVSFKGRELQVIPKIVEYKLKPGQSYEGVWHCEGMSHENIVMTGIYFLDRDSDIDGASLRFKRAFTLEERNFVFWSIPQIRPSLVNETAYDGFVPLGEFPTEEGRLLVFPNCHVHKLAKLENVSDTKSARRRIVVFFFVNPEKQIISTREVPPQQKVINLADAKAHRLELMAERKYDKMKLNVRDIELCEH